MSEQPKTLAAALAAFQAELPTVVKDATATVQTKQGGTYKYSYADLAKVSSVVLPRLGAVGLSFVAKPTLNAEGKFVLAYKLLHVSGEYEPGEYPLPNAGTAQELGSAITYARRYALCSVTGCAPDEDDDGEAASKTRTVVGSAQAIDPAIADGFDDEIRLAKTHAELDDISKRLKTAANRHDVTRAAYDRLFIAGQRRWAEIEAETKQEVGA